MRLLEPFSIKKLTPLLPLWNRSVKEHTLALLQKIFTETGKALHLELFFRPPRAFDNFDPAVWEVLPVVEQLQAIGVVKTFQEALPTYPDEPQGHLFRSTISGRGGLGYRGVGKDMTDKTKAAWASVGEALERWSLSNYYPNEHDLIDTSYTALDSDKLDIFSVAGFSEKGKQKGHEEYNLAFDEHTEFRWTTARSLVTGKILYIPLQLVSFGRCYEISATYGNRDEDTEPLITSVISSGAATGGTTMGAVEHGVLELIERDAFMIYWLNSIAPEKIRLSSIEDEQIKDLLFIAERYALEVTLLYLRSDFPVNTVCCVIRDRTGIGPAIYVDAKSGFELIPLIQDVLSEALATRQAARRFLDTHDIEKKEKADQRAMAYKDRMLHWFDPSKADAPFFFTTGRERDITAFTGDCFDGQDAPQRLKFLTAAFEEKGYELFFKELLNRKTKRRLQGMSAVVVKSPQLQPLFLDESLATIATGRVRTFPPKIGEAPAQELNSVPHPFL